MASPPPPFSPELLARLEAVGSYTYHRPALLGRWIGVPAEVEWESPAGFANDFAPIAVALWFSAGRGGEGELARLLDALDEFRGRLAEHVQHLRSLIVREFRDAYEPGLPDFVRQRLAGDSETISDAAILREVTAVGIRFDATGKTIRHSAGVSSEWSGEAGLAVECDELGTTGS
jgi:hypothetical protein